MSIHIDGWEHRVLSQAYAPLENRLVHRDRLSTNRIHLQRAYAHCAEITREHSRTFYLASGLLPGAQSEAMRALYAFCRVSDDLVDESKGERTERLMAWRRRVSEPNPPADDLVALAWADTRSRYAIPGQYADQLLAGVSRDLSQSRYETFVDLAEYCYAVASTVGLMSMHIVGYSGKEAIPYAVKLGVALQLTNILRDVAEDWQNGRLYLPREEMVAFGLTEADIQAGHVGERWSAFMRFQITRARHFYAHALPAVRFLARGGRFAVRAAAELYMGILDGIEANEYDVFSQRAFVKDRDKLARLPGIWWRSRFGKA